MFLFKLHSPNNFIVGGGLFGHASIVPISLAWEAFGDKNGAASLDEMRGRVARYRREPVDFRTDYSIGCRILEQPFFWPRDLWLPIADRWAPSIVVGKGFDTGEADGRFLWDAVRDRLAAAPVAVSTPLGPSQLRDDTTPPPVLYDIEDPWGRFDFDPNSRPWNDQLGDFLVSARPDRMIIATSRLDVAQAAVPDFNENWLELSAKAGATDFAFITRKG